MLGLAAEIAEAAVEAIEGIKQIRDARACKRAAKLQALILLDDADRKALKLKPRRQRWRRFWLRQARAECIANGGTDEHCKGLEAEVARRVAESVEKMVARHA